MFKISGKIRVDNTSYILEMERPTHRVIHLVVTSNVSMECSQHNHGNHPRQEKNNHQGVHDTERKIIQSLLVETKTMQNFLSKIILQDWFIYIHV